MKNLTKNEALYIYNLWLVYLLLVLLQKTRKYIPTFMIAREYTKCSFYPCIKFLCFGLIALIYLRTDSNTDMQPFQWWKLEMHSHILEGYFHYQLYYSENYMIQLDFLINDHHRRCWEKQSKSVLQNEDASSLFRFYWCTWKRDIFILSQIVHLW